jgi:PAS domain S-box-containing protein
MGPNNHSVATRVIVTIVAVATLLLTVLGTINYRSQRDSEWDELRSENATRTQQASAALALPLWNFDREQIDKVIDSLMQTPEVAGVVVRQADVASAGGFATYLRSRDAEWKPIVAASAPSASDLQTDERPIAVTDETLGSVKIFATPRFLRERMRGALLIIVLRIVLLDLLLVISLVLLLWHVVLKPLRAIERYAGSVSGGTRGAETTDVRRFRGELESVRASIEVMVNLLDARYAEVEQHQAMLSGILDTVPLSIFWKDREGRYLGCNRVFAEAIGVSDPARAVGKTDDDLPWTADDTRRYRAADEEVIEGGKPKLHVVERMRCADGKELWVSTSKVPLVGGDAKPYGILAVCDDVTDRVESERKLAKSAQFGELITNVLARFATSTADEIDPVIDVTLKDLAGLTGVNCVTLVQISNDRAYWTATHEWHAPGVPSVAAELKRLPMNSAPWSEGILLSGGVVQIASPDEIPQGAETKRARWDKLGIESALQVPLRGHGLNVCGCLALLSLGRRVDWSGDDVQQLRLVADAVATALERKRADEALRASEEELRALNLALERRVQDRTRELQSSNEELEAFSYSISHDLRAPLRAISGFAGVLMEDHRPRLSDDAVRCVGIISENARQMGSLIDDLLRFSRLSRQEVVKETVNVKEMVAEVVKEAREGESAGRRIEVSCDGLPACKADASLLRQVFTNLISNAMKYTRKRDEAKIEVGYRERSGEESAAYFVRDNGAGFDMAYADKLFGVFQRLHGPSEYEGTGVGLAIVRRIVERHGGRVWAQGAVDRGATFWFSLPC